MWARVSILTRGACPVSALDMRQHLRIDDPAEDLTLSENLSAALALIDGPEGLGVACLAQTWRLTLDTWADRIALPGWPVTGISAITYLDTADTWQTLDHAAAFHVLPAGQDTTLARKAGVFLPALASLPAAVRIDYTLGHASAAAIDPSLLAAIKLLGGHYYENREATTAAKLTEIPLGVAAIFARYARGQFA